MPPDRRPASGSIEAYERVDQPQFWVEADLAACNAVCGQKDRTALHLGRLFAMRPEFNMSWFRTGLPISSEANMRRLLDSLRLAGIPD